LWEGFVIEAIGLSKSYGAVEAVRDVSFTVDKGEIVGLLGPNGAGKTTIMKILTCYLFPTAGTASVAGCDVFENPLGAKRAVGYLPENAPLYTDLTVREYLSFIADARRLSGEIKKQRLEWVIGECGLREVLNRNIDELSKGFRQRTGIAQAMIHDPEILILDEPTTGLDPHQIVEIRELIRNLGKAKTVILSTHILQEVEATCQRIFILNEGRIVAQGTREEIERELRGEVLLDLSFLFPEPRPSVEELLGVEGVRKIISAENGAGRALKVRLSLAPDSGAEEKIFDWAVSRKVKIIAMVPKRLSLEDIFIKLTEGGPQPPAETSAHAANAGQGGNGT
jgi:ABC-2 type transport system ATP-binding protein